MPFLLYQSYNSKQWGIWYSNCKMWIKNGGWEKGQGNQWAASRIANFSASHCSCAQHVKWCFTSSFTCCFLHMKLLLKTQGKARVTTDAHHLYSSRESLCRRSTPSWPFKRQKEKNFSTTEAQQRQWNLAMIPLWTLSGQCFLLAYRGYQFICSPPMEFFLLSPPPPPLPHTEQKYPTYGIYFKSDEYMLMLATLNC